jgi:uncharacterized protein YbjT (DUF2867 family)
MHGGHSAFNSTLKLSIMNGISTMQEPIDRNKTILVVGATGKQGGAVSRHLLKNGFTVRALTRNLTSPASEKLVALGATIAIGNLDDRDSLKQALMGVDGVFSVQNYWEKGVGYAGEIRQGKILVDAAKSAGVRHFVQSTMADGRTFPDRLEHFKSKAEIEKYIKAIQLPYTLLGTVTFMDNILDPAFGGEWTFPFISGVMKPDAPYHMLSVDDLGGIAAAVFANAEKYIGKKIDLASDRPTVPEMKQIYRSVGGRPAKWFQLPVWLCKLLNREFVEQMKWQSAGNWVFTTEAARNIYPNLTSFEAFLQSHQVHNL